MVRPFRDLVYMDTPSARSTEQLSEIMMSAAIESHVTNKAVKFIYGGTCFEVNVTMSESNK